MSPDSVHVTLACSLRNGTRLFHEAALLHMVLPGGTKMMSIKALALSAASHLAPIVILFPDQLGISVALAVGEQVEGMWHLCHPEVASAPQHHL